MTRPASARAVETRDARILSSAPYRVAKFVIVFLGIAYAASTVLPFHERPAVLDTWFYSVVLVLTAGLALARPILIRQQRAAWTCVGLAVTSWAVGDIYWSAAFSSVDTSEIPVPSPADVLYIGMYPLAYAGFVMLARSVVVRLPASVWLDGVVTSLAAGAVFSAVTLGDVLSAAGGGKAAETITNLSYPIGDLVLLLIAVAALAMVRWRLDPVWWLLGVGAALFAIADTSYLFGLAQDSYTDGSWVDGLWMLGLTLMTLAGSLYRTRAAEDLRGFTALLVPILFSLSALIVLVVGTFVELHPASILLAATCLVAAGIRTALTFEQTRELARSRMEAMTDATSGLGNRRLLDERLPTMMAALGRDRQLALTIISIDHVAEINSTLGYPAGDTILQTVGARLSQRLPDDAVSVRLGGVELAVLRPGSANSGEVAQQTRQLFSSLTDPVPVDGVPVSIELSAGIALSPAHAVESADLIRCAADALRRAKDNRSEIEVYDPQLDIGSDFGPQLFPDLLRGLQRSEFVTYFQPKVDVGTGTPVEFEASLRWHHPTRGIIDSDVVPPLAARAGVSRRLTWALLDAAVRECAAWHRRGVNLTVAADLNAADVLDNQLPYDLARLINSSHLPPSALTLEIAEEVLLIDSRRTALALRQFRTFGARLALDHYGRTAPSLTRLRALPLDELKLDRSFVATILDSPEDAAIVRATIDVARSLDIRVVADGVDSPDLLDAVASYGCSAVQGAALGEPVPPSVVENWLQSRVPSRH